MSQRRVRRQVEQHIPHEIVESIHERLPVKSLVRLRAVSKNWRFSIESKAFQERHLIRRKKSRGADVLFVALVGDEDIDYIEARRRRIVFGSSIICTVKLPPCNYLTELCYGSCKGLLCFYSFRLKTRSFVVNPVTRWYRTIPRSRIQHLVERWYDEGGYCPHPKLGFGEDKVNGTFKLVWLYNSSEFRLENATTCEVFDFATNDWRYLLPASPYLVLSDHKPVHLEGSLYWFTVCKQTKVLSFDLHTETFQVIATPPFSLLPDPRSLSLKPDPRCITMCVLDNRLCVSEKSWPTQAIWFFDPSSCRNRNQTWRHLCSIDLQRTRSWFGIPDEAILPVALLEHNKLLLHSDQHLEPLVVNDLNTGSYDLLLTHPLQGNFTVTPQVSSPYLDGLQH